MKRAANKWMGEVWAHASDLDLGVAWNRTNPPKPEWRDVFRERLTERVVEVIKRQDAVREHREIETLGASGALDYAIGVVKEHLTQRTEDLQSDSLKAVMDYAFESMADEILVRKAIAFMQMTRQLDQVSVNGQARLQWRKR